MVIKLDDKTAQQLLEAASSEGMAVEEFVRTHLLSAAKKNKASSSVTGAMANQADLLDIVVAEAYQSRVKNPLMLNLDG